MVAYQKTKEFQIMMDHNPLISMAYEELWFEQAEDACLMIMCIS